MIFQVHDGTYTQFRLSGFGYGDESLENEISQVKAFVNFTSNLKEEFDDKKKRFNFDLFVFSDTDDYLCYVEAVHLLMHENVRKECGFIDNP